MSPGFLGAIIGSIMKIRAVWIVTLLTLSAAHAEERKVADTVLSKHNVDIHVFNYWKFDKSCRVWTDGCRNCLGDEKQRSCSNIGIVCSPDQTIRCLERKQEK